MTRGSSTGGSTPAEKLNEYLLGVIAAELRSIADPAAREIATRSVQEVMTARTASTMLELRLAALQELRHAGVSYEKIAERTGLSKSRVAQLVRLAEPRKPD